MQNSTQPSKEQPIRVPAASSERTNRQYEKKIYRLQTQLRNAQQQLAQTTQAQTPQIETRSSNQPRRRRLGSMFKRPN